MFRCSPLLSLATVPVAMVLSTAASSPLSGQVGVTPVSAQLAEGRSASLAVANNALQRTQTIYESREVYRPLQSWSALLLRPDNGGTFGSFGAFQRRLTVRLSARGVPSPELASQTSFAANYGADLTTVLDDKPVSFPAHVPNGAGPASFSVRIPLDRPFSMVAGAHLLLEIETAPEAGGPTQWRWYPDAAQWSGVGWTIQVAEFGSGCGPTPQSYWASAGSTSLRTTLRFPASSTSHPAVAWLGASRTQWGPLPLPLPLIGLPGCAILTEPAAVIAGRTLWGTGGSASFSLRVPVPRSPALLGRRVHSQTMVADGVGLRLSPAAEFSFSSPPSPYRGLTLRRTGSLADAPQVVLGDRALVVGMQ